MNLTFLSAIVGCVLLLFTQNSLAQQTTGTINGIVRERFGAVIPNLVVAIKQKPSSKETFKNGNSKFTTTDSDGAFTFQNLPPGIYLVSADFFGMSYKNDNVQVVANQTTKLDVQLVYGGECENSSGRTIELSNADKAIIINEILEDSLLKKEIPDYELLVKQKGEIVLSTENLKPEWVKSFLNVKLKLMSEKEIQEKANNQGDFLYLSFDKFKPKGDCVVVTFTNSWAVGIDSGTGYLSGGGSIYIYRKESGKLVGKYIGGWIS